MAEPVNLNRFRKQKARADKTARATENVARSGRSKVEKQLERARADKARRDLDGHEAE
ncbi:MAG: hypothetical protein ACI8R4_003233 [Paracoccaceae bacterium]|jgi:hypothetical protein